MYSFSRKSMERLSTCCDELQLLFLEVIKFVDCSIVWGFRGEEEQNIAVANGNSTTPWPKSKHNKLPSEAVDAIVYYDGHGSWDSNDALYFAGIVKGVFFSLQAQGRLPQDISLRNGADWDSDNDVYEGKQLKDPYHFEIVRN